MYQQAETVVKICGGVGAVAKMLGLSVGVVYRWRYERERGGTDGLIPAEHQQTLFSLARRRGINLQPRHFFPAPSEAPVKGKSPARRSVR